MRDVVVQPVPSDPDDAQRQERLLELLSTGLQRWLSGNLAPGDSTLPVDYSQDLSPTSYTESTVSERDE